MSELREGAYRFSSRARGQSDIIIEELIDPDGDTVSSIAEVEGDQGAVSLAQSLEIITFDTWLFGQIGDKDELDLKDENHWEVWFTFGAWIGETIRRRHGGHWLLMGEDPHTWRIGFSKVFLEIAPFVFAEQLIKTLQAPFRPMELHDEYREKVLGYLHKKARGGRLALPAPASNEDVDVKTLMDSLTASLARKKRTPSTKALTKAHRRAPKRAAHA